MFKGVFQSIQAKWGIAGVISLSIHSLLLLSVSIYAIQNPEVVKQVYVQIISNPDALKPPEPKPKVRFRPTRVATDFSPGAPAYSEFLPKLDAAPRMNDSLIGGINLVGVKSDVVLPYGEGLLRNVDNLSKVDFLSNLVYEPKKATHFEPRAAEVAKVPLLAAVPSKASQFDPKLSVEFKDLTDTGLDLPKPSDPHRLEQPKWIRKVTPEYPEAARRASIEGFVILEAEIKADGSLGEVKVVESLGYGCDDAAKEALKASKISAARRDGVPISMKIRIPYKFQLES